MSTTPNLAGSAEHIEQLIAELTLEEKVSMMAGASMWTTAPVERLGIPAIKVSDGPNGARGGGGFVGGSVTSAAFPVGVSLASTWDTALLAEVGGALAEEARSKGAHFLLAPTVNIHRSPLNGRNFECYSEDPFLTARLAVAYIEGLQAKGVGATVKHYVGNDSEFERNTISSEIDERTLREIYLPPFHAAVAEAKSWAVMSSYNRVNGTYVGESAPLLLDILKGEWGFDGIVMSDWFGTQSTAAAAANGMDLEMPGPGRWRGAKLVEAVQKGEVPQEAIDEAVRRLLRAIARAGAFAQPEIGPERSDNRPEHRALIRRAAAEGAVLLKNDGALPLDPARITSLALIGPNAKTAQIMGGGSSQINAHYAVTPYDGVAARAGGLRLSYEIGCTNHKQMPSMGPGVLDGPLASAFFPTLDLSGAPAFESSTTVSEAVWLGEVGGGLQSGAFSARYTGSLTPEVSGEHTFGLTSAGRSRLLIDGAVALDGWTSPARGNSFFGTGNAEVTASVPLEAGRRYALTLEYSAEGATLLSGVRLGYLPPIAADSIAAAARAAAQADVALVFVGLNGDWESEGYDRPDMELAGEQAKLIEAVAAANPRTVVVLQTGSPVSMPWLDRVAAVVQAYFPGQECGNAIADVLFGDVNPSGRLTQTYPLRLEDNPAFINYPGENGRVRYGEGIFVGYRYYEKKRVPVQFPFGYGLSYTTFAYGPLALSAASVGPDDTLEVSVDVTNTGGRAGQEVVQLYVRDVAARVARPEKELKGFAKVALQPGETRRVTIALDRAALAFWDDGRHCWVAEAGEFEALVGPSSADVRARATFALAASAAFGGPPQPKVRVTSQTPLKQLLEAAAAREVLERHLPGFEQAAGPAIMMGLSLAQMSQFAPDQLPPELVARIDADLAALADS